MVVKWRCRNCGAEYTNEQVSGILNFLPVEVLETKPISVTTPISKPSKAIGTIRPAEYVEEEPEEETESLGE